MSAMKFQAGQTVFDEHGAEYEYVSALDSGHVVRQKFEANGPGDDDEVETWLGAPTVLHRVLPTHDAAKEKISAELADIQQSIEKANERLNQLREETHAMRRENEQIEKQRKAEYAKHTALSRIDDFIAGKITHFVTASYEGVILESLAAGVASTDKYDRALKLLSLYGDSNGDLQWRINHYSDGSGSSRKVYPFCSEEEALAFARKLVSDELADMVAGKCPMNGAGVPAALHIAVKSASRFGVEVPQQLLDTKHAADLKHAEAVVAKAQEELAKAMAALDAVKGGQP